jgi:alkanesulfonate monooxygenase SsuD/methylene tetrahydromethanopterin reductase-like flavin-dependent oxidoreductase (luciferase family)
MRLGLYIPPFDELADPALVARLCAEAEEAGWDGAFVWDQVRWREPVAAVGDPQITLAAIASATERIRLGPMVTPLARRRPAKVARETATLDLLSDGRLTLGVGLGSDEFAGEYSITGEELDDRKRAAMLDEALGILEAAWTGEPVQHRGEHYTIDAMRFLPRPVQRPGVPIWVAGFYGKSKPLRRAIRYQGFFPVGIEHPTSSPRSPPSSAVSAGRQEMGRWSPSTLPSSSTPVATRRATRRPVPPGAWSRSLGIRCRSTRSVA